MSLNSLFDVGDAQRVEREATLTEQLPRQPIVEDRSPEESDDKDFLLAGLLRALKERLV